MRYMPYFIALVCLSAPLAYGQVKNEKLDLDPALVPFTDEATEVDKLPPEVVQQMLFEFLMKQRVPFTPEQEKLLYESELRKREATKRKKPAVAIYDIIDISSKPGAQPPQVRITPGFDTHLNFIDSTGMPWPIIYQSGGSAEDFTISRIQPEGGNILKVNAVFRKGSTNMTVMLEGLSKPITISLVASEDSYHPVPDMKMDRRGPNASEIKASGMVPVQFDMELKQIIKGGADLPSSFVKLETTDPQVDAWLHKGELFFGTRLTPQTPIPSNYSHGSGGYSAYRSAYLPVIVLTTDNGNDISVVLQEP